MDKFDESIPLSCLKDIKNTHFSYPIMNSTSHHSVQQI